MTSYNIKEVPEYNLKEVQEYIKNHKYSEERVKFLLFKINSKNELCEIIDTFNSGKINNYKL